MTMLEGGEMARKRFAEFMTRLTPESKIMIMTIRYLTF